MIAAAAVLLVLAGAGASAAPPAPAASTAAALGDVTPQLLRSPYQTRDPSWLYYRGGYDGDAVKAFVFPGRDAYPTVSGGEILPPAAYRAEKEFSRGDYERMKKALVVARRYADINNAIADGYLPEEKYGLGMGIHMHNLGYVFSGVLDVAKPQFLTYVRSRTSGRWQLIQLGFIHRGLKRMKIFDSPQALGHFHTENICVAAVDGALRTVPETEPCDGPGERRVGPIWMMHFAVPIYNPNGIFADSFPYADHASLTGQLHTFYGAPVP